MGTQASRERKQNWFILKFKEAYKQGKMLETKKLKAKFALEMLSTERIATEMLKMFENAGMVMLHKDRIEVIKI